ncbi:signal peptidase I [Caldisericum exile]|uniref:Signal peptidase I n=1 Tax=Caldisericum exile (strain DSM 21853 / NBRC 104410 / AZM16c01) TaxID=511051 RepID=A0A7U6JGS7_CALEA|nr:signal peptidase I [Caldisericum exile]BAL80737.1 signal peptidase I [Caldisericum exile AZM16c01]
MSDFQKELKSWIILIIVAFLISFVLRAYVIQPFRVQMTSMVATLEPNDLVLVEKITYRFSKPHRGDVVVFIPPNNPKDKYIKRVIGLPGETIYIKNDTVYIDGKPLKEPYLNSPMADMEPVKVPDGSVFVMGDNRSVSLDSRVFGPIKISSIIGRAILIYWPINHFQFLLAYSGENP